MPARQQRPPPSSLAPKPTAQQVGDEFVASYYAALRNSPAEFHNFYQHNSLVDRPSIAYTANKKQAINRDILSVGDGMPVEVKAVGAQYSVDCGVIVIAKGYLIGGGGVKTGFTQTFFLEPKVLTAKVQRYYISNDIFMYEDGERLHQDGMVITNGSGVAQHDNGKEANGEKISAVLTTSVPSVAEEILSSVAPVAKVIFSAVPTIVKATMTTSMAPAAEATSVAPVVNTSIATSVAPVAPVAALVMTQKSPSTVQGDVQAPMADKSPSSVVQGDAPKKSFPKSFAAIVKDLRDNPAPFALPPSAAAKPKPCSSNRSTPARPKPSNQKNGPKFPHYAGSSGRRGDARAPGASSSVYSSSNGHSGNPKNLAPPKLYFC